MYPRVCEVCGKTLKSRVQTTHHRRLCRKEMVKKIAAVLSLNLEVSMYPGVNRLCVKKRDSKFVVVSEPSRSSEHTTPEDAATEFLKLIHEPF